MVPKVYWVEFLSHLRKIGFSASVFEENMLNAARAYSRHDLSAVFYYLSRSSFAYDTERKRWVWVSPHELTHIGMGPYTCRIAILYSNLEILRVFFDIDLSVDAFKGLPGFHCDSDTKRLIMRWMGGDLLRSLT